VRKAFATPGFTRLFGGLAASMCGDSIMLLVLSMWVKTLTGSNALAGLTFFFMVIASLFGPVLGVWVDRVRRRPLLVWGNVASAVMVMPLVLVRDAGDVWLIWLVAFLYGVSMVVLPAGLNGLLKEPMPEDLLVDANASLQTTKEAFRLFGPLVGAAIFAAVGGWLVAVIDAASFLVAAVVIASITVPEEVPEHDGSHFREQLSAGVRHLTRDRVLGHVLVGFAITMLVLGFVEASIYALLDAFDKPATFAAVFVTVQGVGAIAGGLSSGWVMRRIGEIAGCVAGLVVLAVSMAGVAVTTSLPVMLCFAAVMGVSLPWLMVGYMTLIQRRTPGPLMGRVSTAAELVMSLPSAVSLALGALLVVVLDYRVIFGIVAVATALGAAHILFWLRPEISADVRRHSHHEREAATGRR
jgi:MFS family permease